MVWISVVGGVLGVILGSFLATLVIRWPQSFSGLHGRSRCDACGAPIAVSSLFPVLSYLRQGGRAGCCGARIDPLHPLAEIAAMAIGVSSFSLFGWAGWPIALFGWTVLTLALFDLRYFVLPDWLTAFLALSGLISPVWMASPSLQNRVIGAACGYGALALIRIRSTS